MKEGTKRYLELVDLIGEALREAGFESKTEQGDERDWLVWAWTRERGHLLQKFELLVKRADLRRALANQSVSLKHHGAEVLVDGRTLSELTAGSGAIELRGGVAGSLFWWITRKRIIRSLEVALDWFQQLASIPRCIQRIESGESNLGTGKAARRVLQLLRESSANDLLKLQQRWSEASGLEMEALQGTRNPREYLVDLTVQYDDDVWPSGADGTVASWPRWSFDTTLPLSFFRRLREGFDPRLLAAITGLGGQPEATPPFPKGFPIDFAGSAGEFRGPARTVDSLFDSWLDLNELDRLFAQSGLVVAELDLEARLLLSVLEFLGERCGRAQVRIIFRVSLASSSRALRNQESRRHGN